MSDRPPPTTGDLADEVRYGPGNGLDGPPTRIDRPGDGMYGRDLWRIEVVSTGDREVDAMAFVAAAIGGLPLDAQARILNWAQARHDDIERQTEQTEP